MPTYPSPPGPKIAYDADGSDAVQIDGLNVVHTISSGDTAHINGEDTTFNGPGQSRSGSGVAYTVVLFPQPMDLVGYFHCQNDSGWATTSVQVSDDTTDGLDGTWTVVDASPIQHHRDAGQMRPDYRSDITSISASAVTAFRLKSTTGNGTQVSALHIYGSPTTDTGDRVAIWHPTLDEPLPGDALDYGDITQGSTEDRTFRVKNLSASLTAHSVVVGLTPDSGSDASPSLSGQFTFSIGAGYASTQNLGDLSPGTISGTVTIRRTTDPAAQLQVWAARVAAAVGSWS